MKLTSIWGKVFKVSVLACLIAQTNGVMAGSVNVCDGQESAIGTTTTSNVSTGCTGKQGVALYEWNLGGLSSDYAGIGIGIGANGSAEGAVYINAPNGTTINSTVDMKNHQINKLADGTANSDAVNLGQLKASEAAAVAQSKAYTDTAKADAIAQGKTYTDAAKADAIAQGKTYTDLAKADAIAQGKVYTDVAKADAIAQGKTYTDLAKADAILISNNYTDTAKADAIAQGKTYTDLAKADAILISNNYTDIAKADAIAQGKTYTDLAKADAILISNNYTDIAKADAIAQGKTYTDAAKAEAISTSNYYTDVAKAEAIATSNTYTNQEIDKLSDKVVHYDVNADGSTNKTSITFAGGENGTKLTNVANGKIQANSKDAVNGAQLNITNQALAEYLGGNTEYDTATQSFKAPSFSVGNSKYNNVGDAISALDTRVDVVSNRVDKLEDKVEQGLAMSAAMAGLFQPYGVGKFNLTIAGGGYGSQGALALGSGYRFNETAAFKVGLAAIPGKGKASYNVGMNFEW
ncbi:hypothetical protein B9T31_07680 [Acinetobacter sp. ANC 4558]|uniref:YadA-like family protein n=1 Tax=Acinetobacter sp. ANC 4558 TaxID=1977876 RepID=UPI000A32EE25|nr:YadA-like family protein [Acinetobacter sp. ANC 4558]OTG86371.1 hypothetical protein B9T31_07680 [Acinetobacter sp. ANC 4558]